MENVEKQEQHGHEEDGGHHEQHEEHGHHHHGRDEFFIHIDHKKYEVDEKRVTGSDIRSLAKPPIGMTTTCTWRHQAPVTTKRSRTRRRCILRTG